MVFAKARPAQMIFITTSIISTSQKDFGREKYCMVNGGTCGSYLHNRSSTVEYCHQIATEADLLPVASRSG